MAKVKIFVDDALRGDLPHVCVKTGLPADGYLDLDLAISRASNARWLLLMLGPVGFLALMIWIVAEPRLAVRLPMTEQSVDAYVGPRLRVWKWVVAVGVLAVAAITVATLDWQHQTPEYVAAGAVVAAVLVVLPLLVREVWAIWSTSFELKVDASRQWATLDGVSSRFADACSKSQRWGLQSACAQRAPALQDDGVS